MINQLKTIFKNYNILDKESYYFLTYNKKTIYLYKNDIEFFNVLYSYYIINSNNHYITDNIGITHYDKISNQFDGKIYDMKLSYILPFLRKKKIKLLKNRND